MAKSKADVGEATPSKMKMVERAMEALGDDAGPSEILSWIQSQFSKDVDKQMISSYASQIRRKRRGGKSGTVKVSHGTISFRDISAVKGLINQYGADELKNLIKVLAK